MKANAFSAESSAAFDLSASASSKCANQDGPTLVPNRADLEALVGACSWEPSTSVTLKARPLELDSLRTLAMSAAIDLDSDFGLHLARGLQPRPLPRIAATPAVDPNSIETVRPPSRRAPATSGTMKIAGTKAAPRARKSRSNLARVS